MSRRRGTKRQRWLRSFSEVKRQERVAQGLVPRVRTITVRYEPDSFERLLGFVKAASRNRLT